MNTARIVLLGSSGNRRKKMGDRCQSSLIINGELHECDLETTHAGEHREECFDADVDRFTTLCWPQEKLVEQLFERGYKVAIEDVLAYLKTRAQIAFADGDMSKAALLNGFRDVIDSGCIKGEANKKG